LIASLQIKPAGGLIQKQRARPVNQCAAKQQAALLAGGHLAEGPVAQFSDAQLGQYLPGMPDLLVSWLHAGPQVNAGKKSGKNHAHARGVRQIILLQVSGNDAEMRTELSSCSTG
jgi:hypothetical protein